MPHDPDAIHEGRIELGAAQAEGAGAPERPPGLNFVHYPGCQQLQVGLPVPADAYADWAVVDAAGTDLLRAPVAEVASGPGKLLLDTLSWPPGPAVLVIRHRAGWSHRVPFTKRAEGAAVLPQPAASGLEEDLKFRSAALAQLSRRLSRRVEHVGQGRCGELVFVEGERRIRFAYEPGIAPCSAWVQLPDDEHWAAETGTPLSEREAIVSLLGREGQRHLGVAHRLEGHTLLFFHDRRAAAG